jgi:hypothetical protein
VLNEELAEQHAAQLLLLQPAGELMLVDEPSLDEELSEGSPCVFRHQSPIGMAGLSQ